MKAIRNLEGTGTDFVTVPQRLSPPVVSQDRLRSLSSKNTKSATVSRALPTHSYRLSRARKDLRQPAKRPGRVRNERRR